MAIGNGTKCPIPSVRQNQHLRTKRKEFVIRSETPTAASQPQIANKNKGQLLTRQFKQPFLARCLAKQLTPKHSKVNEIDPRHGH